MQKQVDKSHYEFSKYVDKRRWASIWHQLDEVLKIAPENVLEIGPGPGIFKAMAQMAGIDIETLDLDRDLDPDHVGSATDIPIDDRSFDVVCAFQMLEHLPFDQSLQAFREMVRVARKAVVISLPDSAVRWPFSLYIPRLGSIKFSIPKPRLRAPVHQFNGQHYWEINKAGYSLATIKAEFEAITSSEPSKTFRVPEYPYHRFFVFHLTD